MDIGGQLVAFAIHASKLFPFFDKIISVVFFN